jgi:hypothetical protein
MSPITEGVLNETLKYLDPDVRAAYESMPIAERVVCEAFAGIAYEVGSTEAAIASWDAPKPAAPRDVSVEAERRRQAGQRDAPAVEPMFGLRTPREAAARLRCSPKTLNAHVASGVLRYVLVGHGTRRQHKMFTVVDLDAFVASQTRKAATPCPSAKTRARRTTSSTSNIVAIAFSAQPKPRPGAKPKR